MGKKRWTTEEQRTWLEELIPDFVQAQQDKTVRTFLKDMYSKWDDKWPTLLTVEEYKRENGRQDKALAAKEKAVENVSTKK